MNTVILTGNVCSMFDNNTNIRLTIADNYKDNTDYITVTLFNNQMEFARKYMKVGDHIAIQGRISTYKNNMGKEIMGITANNISFEGYKNPSKKAVEENTYSNVNSIIANNSVDSIPRNDSVNSISENDFEEWAKWNMDNEGELPF